MEWIQDTGHKGQELMIDSFLLGIEVGRSGEINMHYLQKITQKMKELAEQIQKNVESAFKRDQLYNRFIGDQKIRLLQMFENMNHRGCQSCGSEIFTKPHISLNCHHEYHKDCLKKYMNVQNNEFKCPQCHRYLDTNHLEQIFTQQELVWINNNAASQVAEKSIPCPTLDCKQKFIYYQDLKDYNCHTCRKQFCLICHKRQHQENEDCQPVPMMLNRVYKECPNCLCWNELQPNQSTFLCQCGQTCCLQHSINKCNCNKNIFKKVTGGVVNVFGKLKRNKKDENDKQL